MSYSLLIHFINLVFSLGTPTFRGISHLTKEIYRKEAQPSFLVIVQARIERLPSVSEFFQGF